MLPKGYFSRQVGTEALQSIANLGPLRAKNVQPLSARKIDLIRDPQIPQTLARLEAKTPGSEFVSVCIVSIV